MHEHTGNFINFLSLQYGESTSYFAFAIIVLKNIIQVVNANTFSMVLEVY